MQRAPRRILAAPKSLCIGRRSRLPQCGFHLRGKYPDTQWRGNRGEPHYVRQKCNAVDRKGFMLVGKADTFAQFCFVNLPDALVKSALIQFPHPFSYHFWYVYPFSPLFLGNEGEDGEKMKRKRFLKRKSLSFFAAVKQNFLKWKKMQEVGILVIFYGIQHKEIR